MSNRSPFALYRRPRKRGAPVYYVRLREHGTGRYGIARSTGKTTKAAARAYAFELLRAGIDGATEDPRLVDFLLSFWDYERSPYVRDKLARGGMMSRSHCRKSAQLVELHVRPYFRERRILDITAADFSDWMARMRADGRSPHTVNAARQCVNSALNWLAEQRRLPWNPLSIARPYHEDHKRRGILTVAELRALLALEDIDPRIRVAITLGSLCGMRLGEIRALRWGDIAEDLVHVHRSYVLIDGDRPTTKNGSARDVPLPEPARKALQAWRTASPAPRSEDYIMAHLNHLERPIAPDVVLTNFKSALRRIGVTEAARVERNIVFHSCRHWFNTTLRNQVPDSVLRRLTGH
ncbi:MAG: tyrosine-type recombinase/integrase, partial [Spirochaetia bacterium]